MNEDIIRYNTSQTELDQGICQFLMEEIDRNLPEATSKVWHGSPVWFLDDNPIAGYSKQKRGIQLLFWSGQSFEEEALKPVGKYKAAESLFTDVGEVDRNALATWLSKSIHIQWDYKNIAKREGELLRLK